MLNINLQFDILETYTDDIEVKCVDEEGSIYTIEGEDIEAGDNDGDERRGGVALFLKLKKTTAHK